MSDYFSASSASRVFLFGAERTGKTLLCQRLRQSAERRERRIEEAKGSLFPQSSNDSSAPVIPPYIPSFGVCQYSFSYLSPRSAARQPFELWEFAGNSSNRPFQQFFYNQQENHHHQSNQAMKSSPQLVFFLFSHVDRSSLATVAYFHQEFERLHGQTKGKFLFFLIGTHYDQLPKQSIDSSISSSSSSIFPSEAIEFSSGLGIPYFPLDFSWPFNEPENPYEKFLNKIEEIMKENEKIPI